MKVITFSQVFPAFHPKANKNTNFVEKIYASLCMVEKYDMQYLRQFTSLKLEDKKLRAKHHTIREGNRWKTGDWFAPRVWSGRPYYSKQIDIAPPIQIKKVFKFEVGKYGEIWIGDYQWQQPYHYIANNDGLSHQDFLDWIILPAVKAKGFKGQILCWNNKINYGPL